MSKYILYGGRYTRALITEMVMAEGNIEYELREIDIINNEHHSADFLAINPGGTVPVLVTPAGAVLYETPAINLYLAEQYGLTELAPAPGDPDRGLFLSGLFYLTDELEPAMKRFFYPHRYVVSESDELNMQEKSLDDALARLSVIDQRLAASGPYHLGERFSLVDLTLAYWTAYIDTMVLSDRLPNVQRCVQGVMQRPAIRHRFDEIQEQRS